MSSFKRALLWTAIPLIAMSIASAVVNVLRGVYPNSVLVAMAQLLMFGLALMLTLAALVAAVSSIAAHKKQQAAGILAGLGIGLVAYFASCFAPGLLK